MSESRKVKSSFDVAIIKKMETNTMYCWYLDIGPAATMSNQTAMSLSISEWIFHENNNAAFSFNNIKESNLAINKTPPTLLSVYKFLTQPRVYLCKQDFLTIY